MYFWILVLFGTSLAFAADDQQLALALKSQSDFDRVALAAAPQLRDTATCTQSQAAALAAAPAEDLPLLHYRKGYCALAGAAITRGSHDFADAASEFDKAVENWPVRARNGKDRPEPVSSGLKLLASIARLESAPDEAGLSRARAEIGFELAGPSCSSNIMPPEFCRQLLDTAREWLGWISLERGELDQASMDLARSTSSGWSAWAAGRAAFRDRNYARAATEYRNAIEAWDRARGAAAPTIAGRLSPPPDLVAAYTELGGAQLLTGDTRSAIASLDEAVRRDPSSARAFYLRARARELAGQNEQAQADYNLASRTAFAKARDLASGEAHLYRGILLFRRKDYPHAEDEFASALNFEIPAALRAEAGAWRHLAAVADGSCASAREYLERSLGAVSPFFPKDEARAVMASCPAAVTARTAGPNSAR
jgi:tetratricopeptide (TPR) repeat protein